MDIKIEKKLKTGSILKKIMIIAIIFTLLMFILGAATNIIPLISIGFIGFVIAVPTTVIYVERFMSIRKSIKYLNKWEMQDFVNDINSTEFHLPISKICMGNRAFYTNNPPTIIPYSMVAWVYIHQINYMGIIPMDEKINIFCRDGQLFEIRANRNELTTLLQRIQMHSADLIVGYGNEQIKQYNNIKSKFKNK